MTDPAGLLLVALLCAEVAAVGLAVRVRVGRPMLALLAFALMDEVAVQLLHVFVFASAPRPLAGWARAAWHLETAFVLGWPALLAWAAWPQKTSGPDASEPFASLRCASSRGPAADAALDSPAFRASQRDGKNTMQRRSNNVNGSSRTHPLDPLLGAYLGAVTGLIIVYPTDPPGSGSPRLRWTLLVWELACVAVAWLGLWRRRLTPWGPVEVCLVLLVSCESAVCVVGPFASDPFTRWWIARAFYLGAWGAVCGVLARTQRPQPD